MFGVECASGNTFTSGQVKYTMTSMYIPAPVMSLAIHLKKKDQSASFSKAISKFQREDPTFRCAVDTESGETIISGMGELHLDIYYERLRREFGIETEMGKPQVSYRETFSSKSFFDYTHKKQTGGAGQYARIIGYVEPKEYDPSDKESKPFEFVNATIGNNIPPNFMPAIEKGFNDAVEKGPLIGCPVTGIRMVVTDGASHPVDSNEMAFRLCSIYAFQRGMLSANEFQVRKYSF